MKLQGWIFDLYPSPQGMKLWLIEPNQKRHLLIDRFAPSFYAAGSRESLRHLQAALATRGSGIACHLTERIDIWERDPLALVEIEADEENRLQAIACRDDEWALDYDTPPFEIMQVRLGGLSRIDPAHGRLTSLEVEVDGRSYELDESGEPAAVALKHLLQQHDPDLIITDWGDSTILPRVRRQAEQLRLALPFNRDAGARVQQSRARSYMSYGR